MWQQQFGININCSGSTAILMPNLKSLAFKIAEKQALIQTGRHYWCSFRIYTWWNRKYLLLSVIVTSAKYHACYIQSMAKNRPIVIRYIALITLHIGGKMNMLHMGFEVRSFAACTGDPTDPFNSVAYTARVSERGRERERGREWKFLIIIHKTISQTFVSIGQTWSCQLVKVCSQTAMRVRCECDASAMRVRYLCLPGNN